MKSDHSPYIDCTLPASHAGFLKPVVAILLIALLVSSCACNRERHFTLNNTRYVELKSELTGRDHELIISLPASYDSSPDKHYPVLYYMDAYWDTPLLAGIYGNLVWDNVLPEMIMVGFSYPGKDADYDDLRERDFTPTRVASKNPDSGNAGKFLQFIETSVIPYVDSHYRTDPNERAMSGNSLGGLFTLYTMYTKPELFKRFIAVSPAVNWDNEYLSRLDDAYAAKHRSLPVRLFLSQGSDEYAPFREPIVALQGKLAGWNYDGLALLDYTIKGERHVGVKSDGYTRGLRWVFKDIAPTGPSGLEKAMLADDD